MGARQDVFDFLRPIDARLSFLATGEMLLAASARDEVGKQLAEAADAVFRWLRSGKTPAIRAETLARCNRIRRRDRSGHLPGASAELEPLVAVLYLRAKSALENARGLRAFGDALTVDLPKVNAYLSTVEEDFLGELLLETEVRALHDPTFASALDGAVQEIAAAAPRLQDVASQLGPLFGHPARGRPGGAGGPEEGTDHPVPMMRMEDCDCTVTVCNGSGRCYDLCIGRWWICALIILAIIVIVVLTL